MISSAYSNKHGPFLLGLISLFALAGALILARNVLHKELLEQAKSDALLRVKFISTVVEKEPGFLDKPALFTAAAMYGVHLSHISPQGDVLADSAVIGDVLFEPDNLSDRQEFIIAKERGAGVAVRTNMVDRSKVIYAMTRLSDTTFLRLALPFAQAERVLQEQFYLLLTIISGGLLLAFFFFFLRTRQWQRDLGELASIVAGIACGNYAKRVTPLGRDEFIPLAQAVRGVARQLRDTLQTVQSQESQLQTLFSVLPEGIAVLGEQGKVSAYNDAFSRMFSGAAGSVGKQIIEVIPLPGLQDAVEQILCGKEPEATEFLLLQEPGVRISLKLYVANEKTGSLTLLLIAEPKNMGQVQ